MRNLLTLLVAGCGLLIAAWFSAINPGVIDLDLAFTRVEITKSFAIVAALGLGWVFGLLCTGVYILRILNERRRLRKSLGLAEAEVNSLRSMPTQDAD